MHNPVHNKCHSCHVGHSSKSNKYEKKHDFRVNISIPPTPVLHHPPEETAEDEGRILVSHSESFKNRRLS